MQFVSIYAAYLYDSVKLYADALDKLLKQEREEGRELTSKVIQEVANNGTRIIETIIKNRTYKSKHNFIDFRRSFHEINLANRLKSIF